MKLAIAVLSFSFLSLHLEAQCTNASLNGTYFYQFNGSINHTPGNLGYEELGKLTADGIGTVSGSSTAVTNGAVAALTFTGTYAIQANCSGTATLNFSNQTTDTLTLQLYTGGQFSLLSVTSGGGELTGRFYRSGGSCSNASFNGAFASLSNGSVLSGTTSNRFSNTNQIVSDGNGNMTLSGVTVLDGATGVPYTGTGTYTLGSDCTGTAKVTVGNLTTNFNIVRPEGGNLLILETDAGATISGTAALIPTQDILPQFVYGGGWYSALYFTNSNAVTASFLVNFTSDAGAPLSVPGVGASKQVTIPSNGTAIIEALNVGALTQGYATFSLPTGVTGYGIFRQSVAGRLDQEAVVPFRNSTSTSATLTWDDTSFTTTVAIANPSAVSATVNITVRDSNGTLIGTSPVVLPAFTKTENVLRGYLGLAGMAGLRGSAQFTVSTGNVAVLGLRFGGTAFTSIPTTQQ